MPAASDHPAAEAWTPAAPPPPGRRVAPGLVAAVIALLLVFGAIGVTATRHASGVGAGAGSPEAAADGLLAALDRDEPDASALDRAARFLTGEEHLLATTYAGRIAKLAATASSGGQSPLEGLAFGARDVRFQRLGGARDVVVLEAVAGTVSVRTNRGGRLQLSLEQARQRLAEQTKGAVTSLRVVTLRSGGRWYVSLLASGLEWARLAGHGGPPDYGALTGAPAAGADSAEAAVRALLDSVDEPFTAVAGHLVPDERNAVNAYLPSVPSAELDELLRVRSAGAEAPRPTGRTEQVADGVVRVYLSGGGEPGAHGPHDPYVVAVERDGTWYPSMVFTGIDVTLTGAEQEHS